MAETLPKKLPLPGWCFVLLAVPTFYMPLAYLGLVVWAIGGILSGDLGDPPEWLEVAMAPAIGLVPGMWPIYVAWVGLSRRLTWKEKSWWLFIVLFLNMVGMPIFYVFMIRRYLGVEGRIGKRDELCFDRFLRCHALSREQFSSQQLTVLRSYCRNRRLARWVGWGTIPVAGLMLFMAITFFPQMSLRLSTDFVPTRTIIVNSDSHTTEEIVPDLETQRLHAFLVMMFGAMAGVMATISLVFLVLAIAGAFGIGESKGLIDFLKATGTRASADPPSDAIEPNSPLKK